MSPDLIFSYWIIVWYLLYCFHIVFINPKFSIICGLFVNMIILMVMFYCKTKINIIFSFFALIFISKLIPLFTLWKTKIKRDDVYATFLLFGIYLIWITKFVNQNFVNQINDVIGNKNVYPGMAFVQSLNLPSKSR